MLIRFSTIAAFLLIGAESASADYVLVKINVNQLNFFPGGAPMPATPGGGAVGGQPMPTQQPDGGIGGIPPAGIGGGAGGTPKFPPGGGAFGMPPMMHDPSNPNAPPAIPVDPNAKWLSAWVEIKNDQWVGNMPNGAGFIVQFQHNFLDIKKGRRNWAPQSYLYPWFPQDVKPIKAKTFATEFDVDLRKEAREKTKNLENILHLARKALQRGYLKGFHDAMKEAGDLDPKHVNVKLYLKVKKDLSKPFSETDPVQQEYLDKLRADNYKPILSEQKHFCIYANYAPTDRYIEPTIRRRLVFMEETLETFYYWFAMQKIEPRQAVPVQPNLPRHRLVAVLANTRSEFLERNLEFGAVPIVGDGFTPRRDNILVMSAKARILDPVFQDFDPTLREKIAEASNKLQQAYEISFSPEDLLSGKINENKKAGQVAADSIGAAQVATLLAKTLEDRAERATISHQVVRQLLTASGAFPRNVHVPDWMVEGLAAFFETPNSALYPSIGGPNTDHLISFKHLCGKRKDSADILFNVVTDRYFQNARRLSAEVQENRDNKELRLAEREAWELARCTAWAFVYYLSQNGKLDQIFRYGKELDNLPRDLDLPDSVMHRSFARAFEMTDTKDPRRIAPLPLANMAQSWFSMMQETNLAISEIQKLYLEERGRAPGSGAPGGTETSPGKSDTSPAPGINPTTPGSNTNPGASSSPPAIKPNPRVNPNPGADSGQDPHRQPARAKLLPSDGREPVAPLGMPEPA